MRLPWALAFLAAFAAPAHAEVAASEAASFTLKHTHDFASPAKTVWRHLIRPQDWWSSEHTYSGDAANLTLKPQAGGCYCEVWGKNSVEHARVIFVNPEKTLRLNGALGPLQEMGVTGILTFTLAEHEYATSVTMTYRVSGAPADKLDEIAPMVDKVLGEQFSWLTKRIETADAE